MSTYGAMQDRIADELVRPDLSDQIRLSIKTAIAFYESKRFYFNEGRATLMTEAQREYYGLPLNFQKAEALSIERTSGHWNPLTLRTWAWVEEQPRYNGNYNCPTDYAVFAGQLRLFRIPDAAYRIQLGYAKSLPDVESASDTNAWFIDGEEIVRLHAKADLLMNVIRGQEAIAEASALKQFEKESADRLLVETSSRLATGSVEPFL